MDSGYPPMAEKMKLTPVAPPAQGISLAKSSASAATGEGELAEPGDEAPRRGRGPDLAPRRTYREAGQSPEAPDIWTSFDIGRVVRLL